MENEYKKLFDFLFHDFANDLIKTVYIYYKMIPNRNNYEEIRKILDYYKVDTYGELLNILAKEYGYGDMSDYISMYFYDKTLNTKINSNNFSYAFLNPMNNYDEDEVRKFMENVDYEEYIFLNTKLKDDMFTKEELIKYKEFNKKLGFYAECLQLDYIKNILNLTSCWVSKRIGDGFGFDFMLNFDLSTNKADKIVDLNVAEVKSSLYSGRTPLLTANEYNSFKKFYNINTTYSIFYHYLKYDETLKKKVFNIEEYKYYNDFDIFSCERINENLIKTNTYYNVEKHPSFDAYKLSKINFEN